MNKDTPADPLRTASESLRQPVMADGKTPLLDYLSRDLLKDNPPTDDWTRGFEECKRRLYKILAPQYVDVSEIERQRLAAQEPPQVDAFEIERQMLAAVDADVAAHPPETADPLKEALAEAFLHGVAWGESGPTPEAETEATAKSYARAAFAALAKPTYAGTIHDGRLTVYANGDEVWSCDLPKEKP